VDPRALTVGLIVMAIMLLWPRSWNARFPASLLGIIVTTAMVALLGWSVPQIGAIPRSIFLAERLTVNGIPWAHLGDLVAAAVAIAALGAVESLLCGAVASNMTGIRLHANQELIAQGVGNLVIPFFGGVPATAAIARSSVGIRAGGRTRMVSVVHAVALLLSVFLLAPVMALIPLSALAGVLMITAWRMNEWDMIHFVAGRRFKTAAVAFTVTMLATITLDLTQAILVGAFLSAVVFVAQISRIDISLQPVDAARLQERGLPVIGGCDHIYVAYVSGPLFFAATSNFHEAFAHLEDVHALILSMRGVPLIDVSGLQAIAQLQARMATTDGTVMLAGLQPRVQAMLERGGVIEAIGTDHVFWGADLAILAAERRPCAHCAATVFLAAD
jgi:SulP family sulfate permease